MVPDCFGGTTCPLPTKCKGGQACGLDDVEASSGQVCCFQLALISKLTKTDNVVRLGDQLPKKTAGSLIPELKPFISASDLTNLPYVLSVLTGMLKTPKSAIKPSIEKDLLPSVVDLTKSPSIHGSSLEALQDFFATYTAADPDSSIRMVPNIVKLFDVRQPVSAIAIAGEGSTVTYATAAKCIGVILKHSRENFAGILTQFIKPVQVSAKLCVFGLCSCFTDILP